MSKKKIGITAAVVIVVIAAIAAGLWFLLKGGAGAGNNGDKVYVESVKTLTNFNTGMQNRYSGVVEPQKSWEVKKNQEKTVKELFVAEGDTVEEGTPLFEYDTESIKDQIAQAKLELEGIGNEISGYNSQISALQEERNQVSEDEKFQYTTQIQTLQTSIRQAEYNRESKKVEIQKLEDSVENAVVTSDIAGIIKSISESGFDQYTGQELPYITVLAVGDYRIKGTINEQNIYAITPGSQVLIRSRIDEEQTWMGTITEVDTNSQVKNNNNGGFYDGAASSETATKYPFYIALDNAEGLILGQHVYIEMDYGQTEQKEGIWLYESYIVMEESGSYVWADNGKNKLEKRKVELGEYDADMGLYQITSGLTEEDFITFPMDSLYEGVTTVTDASEVDYSSPMYSGGGEGSEGGMEDFTGEETKGEPIDIIDGMEGGADGADMGADGLDMNGMEGGVDGSMDGTDSSMDEPGAGSDGTADGTEPEVSE